jgi:hypothetical protein
VRFSNIFHVPGTDAALLNDWGSTSRLGIQALVEYCPAPFCHPDLVTATDAVPGTGRKALSVLPGLFYSKVAL